MKKEENDIMREDYEDYEDCRTTDELFKESFDLNIKSIIKALVKKYDIAPMPNLCTLEDTVSAHFDEFVRDAEDPRSFYERDIEEQVSYSNLYWDTQLVCGDMFEIDGELYDTSCILYEIDEDAGLDVEMFAGLIKDVLPHVKLPEKKQSTNNKN